MSRFLEHLVARSLGTPGLLQPRLIGRFEPPSIRHSAGRFERSSVEADVETVPPFNVAKATEQPNADLQGEAFASQMMAINNHLEVALPTPPVSLSPLPELSHSRRDHQVTLDPVSPKETYTEPRSRWTVEAVLHRQLGEGSQRAGWTKQRVEPRQRVELALPDSPTMRPEQASTTAHPLTLPAEADEQEAGSTPMRLERRTNLPALVRRIHPTVQVPPLEETADQPGDSVGLSDTPAHAQQLFGEAARRGRDTVHSEPSSVQITIGRLEVRVVPPTLPQPVRPRTETKLSLDQYLKQRDGGER